MINEKYIKFLQNLIDEDNLGLTIKSMDIKQPKGVRYVAVTFKEKSKIAKINLCTSSMISYGNGYHDTCLAGEHHDNFTDDENARIGKVSNYLANIFWFWLSWRDAQYKDAVVDHHISKDLVLQYMESSFLDRKDYNPKECNMITFKDAIDNYNEQYNDGIFGKKATMIIDYGDYAFSSYPRIDKNKNIFS